MIHDHHCTVNKQTNTTVLAETWKYLFTAVLFHCGVFFYVILLDYDKCGLCMFVYETVYLNVRLLLGKFVESYNSSMVLL